MAKKYHNHPLQTLPLYPEEKYQEHLQPHDSETTSSLFLTVIIVKLEITISTALQEKDLSLN